MDSILHCQQNSSYRHIGFYPQYTKYLEVNDYSMLVMELIIGDHSRNW